MKYVATTPQEIDSTVAEFCRSIEPQHQPLFVDVAPDDAAMMGACYLNVADYVAINGGELQYGWLIWQLTGIYLTAEHHAVVRKGEALIDITPPLGGERRVLFLPSALAWSGKPITNKYAPVKSTPLTQRVCELQLRNCELFNSGRFGTNEFYANDVEATVLIDRFYRIKRSRELDKRRRKSRR